VLLAVEVGAVKEGSGFLPSRQVLGRAITACAIKRCDIKVCPIERVPSKRVLSRRVRDLAIKVSAGVGRTGLGFPSYSTGRSGLGSLRALQVGLVTSRYNAGVWSGSLQVESRRSVGRRHTAQSVARPLRFSAPASLEADLFNACYPVSGQGPVHDLGYQALEAAASSGGGSKA